ncbi:MAG: LysM peptidoglycan-binding domain-containing protein [Rubrobacteraceae bacterium]
MRPDHTYRRRRLGALLVGATAFFAFYAFYAGTGAEAEGTPTSYTVSRGDTLWSIATVHYSRSEDPRVRVSEIREMNHLKGYTIQPGEHLKLPPR